MDLERVKCLDTIRNRTLAADQRVVSVQRAKENSTASRWTEGLFLAVDPKLCNGQNDPNVISCQKAKVPVFGKASGLIWDYLIN